MKMFKNRIHNKLPTSRYPRRRLLSRSELPMTNTYPARRLPQTIQINIIILRGHKLPNIHRC